LRATVRNTLASDTISMRQMHNSYTELSINIIVLRLNYESVLIMRALKNYCKPS